MASYSRSSPARPLAFSDKRSILPRRRARDATSGLKQSNADGFAAQWVEEVQAAGVDRQLKLASGADDGAGRDAGGPQRLAARQRGDGLVLFGGAVGRAGDRGVPDRRRVDGEDRVDLGAELLGDADRADATRIAGSPGRRGATVTGMSRPVTSRHTSITSRTENPVPLPRL